MKHNIHKPYRIEPAVHPRWRPVVPTRMKRTMTIQPAAPTLPGNWCHLFTPLKGEGFSNTTDTVFGQETNSADLLRAMTFSDTTDAVFRWDVYCADPLKAKGFLHATDTVFGQEANSADPLHARSVSYAAGFVLEQGTVFQPEAMSVVPVSAGAFWLGRGGEKRCPCYLKAGRGVMGCISHTSFLGDGCRLCGGGVCYAQVRPAVLSSSSSFHPANPEGVPSRCTP